MILATNNANMDERITIQEISTIEDYLMNTKIMNKINDNGNIKTAVKLDEIQFDVKYDGLYPVTPTKEITVNGKV